MVHNENAEWEDFSALLDDVVPDTSDSAQHIQSDASHDSQTNAQAQDELQSTCTDEDDSDLEEVDVDRFAMKAEMEAKSGTTAQHSGPTHKALVTAPDVTEAQDGLPSGSSSTAATRSAEPQSEAAANRARATERGYLARRRAMRKSASVQTAKDETSTKKKAALKSQHAGARTRSAPSQGQQIAAALIPNAATTLPSTPSTAAATHPVPQAVPQPQTGSRQSTAPAPTSVPTPSASSSSALGIPTPSSSHAATSPATLPPPPPLPVGAAGRRQLWEETLRLGLPRVKAEYRVTLPPARPASAPVVGAASAGPVPSVAARHQSAPVASSSRGKRSRDQEDRGDGAVQKRPKVNNAQSRKRTKASAPSPLGGAHRPQWIPYAAPRAEPSRIHGSAPVSQQNAARDQQPNTRHQRAEQVPRAQPRRAGPSTETSRQMTGAPMYRAGREGAAASTTRLPPPPTVQRPVQVTPGAGPSHRSDEPRTSAQTYATPVMPSSWYDPASGPGTFSRAVLSASASVGTGNRTHSEVHGNATGPQQGQPEMPEAGPSRRAYEQVYNRAGVEHPYDQPETSQSYMTPVPSGWNDPAAIPRTFARAGASTSVRQMEGDSVYRQVQDAPVAYAQTAVPPMYGGGMVPGPERLPSVVAPASLPVYGQPYAPPMPAGWNSSAQLQAMSGGETVPTYLTMYAPPNHPPPGWNPQAPVYEQEPSAQSFSRGQSTYGYGYDF